MQRQVGWFVMIGIGAIVIVILVISLRTDVFAKKFNLYISPPSASGFYIGQPVKLQGFAIGRVGNMELDKEGRGVRIRLTLLERYRSMLHTDGIARIAKEGLIGEDVVELLPGTPANPMVKDGDQLNYETEATIKQLLEDAKPAVRNANTLLRELADLATWLNDPHGDFRQMTARLNQVSKGIKPEHLEASLQNFSLVMDRLHLLVEQIEKNDVAKRLSDSLETTTAILADLRPLSKKLGQEGPQAFDHVSSLLAHVDELSSSLDVVAADLAELTPELPGLARESRATIVEIRGLLQNLRNSWLFGGGSVAEETSDELVAPPAVEMRP